VVGAKQRVIATILLGLAPRWRIGPAMRFFDLLFDGYIGATPQILVSGALINIPRRSLAVVGRFSRFLSADAQIFISQFDYRGLKTPCDKPLAPTVCTSWTGGRSRSSNGI